MGLTPEQDIVSAINTGVAAFTTGTNLFYGPVRPADQDNYPSRACFVFPSGGVEPEAFLGQTYAMRRSSIQIRTRGNRQDFAGALVDARAVRDAVHQSPSASYLDWRVMQSEPIFLGPDEAGHPEFSINVEAQFRE